MPTWCEKNPYSLKNSHRSEQKKSCECYGAPYLHGRPGACPRVRARSTLASAAPFQAAALRGRSPVVAVAVMLVACHWMIFFSWVVRARMTRECDGFLANKSLWNAPTHKRSENGRALIRECYMHRGIYERFKCDGWKPSKSMKKCAILRCTSRQCNKVRDHMD